MFGISDGLLWSDYVFSWVLSEGISKHNFGLCEKFFEKFGSDVSVFF